MGTDEQREWASQRKRAGILRRIARHRAWTLLCAIWLGFTIKYITRMGDFYVSDNWCKVLGGAVGGALVLSVWLLPMAFPRDAKSRKRVIFVAVAAGFVYLGCYAWLLTDRDWKWGCTSYYSDGEHVFPVLWRVPDRMYSLLDHGGPEDGFVPNLHESLVGAAYAPLKPLTDLTWPGRRYIYDPPVVRIYIPSRYRWDWPDWAVDRHESLRDGG